jgi:hypothetical protein
MDGERRLRGFRRQVERRHLDGQRWEMPRPIHQREARPGDFRDRHGGKNPPGHAQRASK